MSAQGNESSISKSVWIPTALVIGSGVSYMIYQLYISSQRCKILNLQVSVLTQRLVQLETEVSQIRSDLEHSGSSDDEFVDANDGVGNSQLRTIDLVHGDTKDEVKGLKGSLSMIDTMIEQGGVKNLTGAYHRLTQLSKSNPKDADVYWRLAQTTFLLKSAEALENPSTPLERKQDLMLKAKAAAENSVKCDESNAYAHKWMAIVLGSMTKDLSIKEQIKSAFIIKDHIDRAIELNPNDSIMYHMKGRWCYSFYNLSWFERKFAATLFGELPEASLEESIRYFEKAEELKPESSLDNLLYLAKVYIAAKEYKQATKCLISAETLPCKMSDDQKTLDEIKHLLNQYKKYVE